MKNTFKLKTIFNVTKLDIRALLKKSMQKFINPPPRGRVPGIVPTGGLLGTVPELLSEKND